MAVEVPSAESNHSPVDPSPRPLQGYSAWDDGKIQRFLYSDRSMRATGNIARDKPIRINEIRVANVPGIDNVLVHDIKTGTRSQFSKGQSVPAHFFVPNWMEIPLMFDILNVTEKLSMDLENLSPLPYTFTCQLWGKEPE